MEFLKVGKYIINVNAISHIEFIDKLNIIGSEPIEVNKVEITMLSIRADTRQNVSITKSEILIFEDEEANIVRNYFEKLG